MLALWEPISAIDSGTITSDGYNLSSDDGGGFLIGPGDQINTDPMLGPLQDNGGPTLTHALLPGSPAIDAGDPSFTPPPFYDQRGPGFDRVVNGRIDIGSFEVQATPTPTPTPTATATQRNCYCYCDSYGNCNANLHTHGDSYGNHTSDTDCNADTYTYSSGYSNAGQLSRHINTAQHRHDGYA